MAGSTVPMAMMQVRKMRVAVDQRRMLVAMGVRFAGRSIRPMFMLVMRIVDMPVFVLYRFVVMLVRVPFGQMQVKADTHQHGCGTELGIEGL